MLYFIFSRDTIWRNSQYKIACFDMLGKLHPLECIPDFLSRSIFHWLHRIILQFFCRCHFQEQFSKKTVCFQNYYHYPNFFEDTVSVRTDFRRFSENRHFVLQISPQKQHLQQIPAQRRRGQSLIACTTAQPATPNRCLIQNGQQGLERV